MAVVDAMISLHMKDIVYDIANKAYLTGRSKEEASSSAVNHMQVTSDENVNNQIMRSVGEAYKSLRVELAEWLTKEYGKNADNLPISGTAINVYLDLPSNYNRGMLQVAADAMHSYIVNMALADWFSITDKDDAEIYANKATADVAKLKEAINKRYRPVRPN